uniref:Phosphoprotein n=1 Tax=avian paramyxovirus 5 TaxID=2560315 RepID=A0A1B4WRT3_9MONO|nr:phosphoprotein [Avian metaavulavirus 5]
MDITDDQAILDLLTLSNDVIESIQHAESAGSQPPTYGRSTIPKGTTMALTQAWEAESNPTQPQSSTSPSQLDHIRVDQDSNKNHDNLKNQLDNHHHTNQDSETHPNIQANPPVNCTNEEDNPKLVQQRDPSTTWEGGSMLDRELDAIQSKIKRGKTTKSAHQPSHTATHQTPNNLDDNIKKGPRSQIIETTHTASHQPPNTQQNQTRTVSPIKKDTDSSQQLSPATDASTPFLSLMEGAASQNGAIPPVAQSLQSRVFKDAPAGNALDDAQCVGMILKSISSLNNRLDSIEAKINELVKSISTTNQIKSDTQQIKASCALLEGQMAMIQVLEPGHADVSSLNEMKQRAKSTIIINSDPACPTPPISNNTIIVKDDLARPSFTESPKVPSQTASGMLTDFIPDIEMLKALMSRFDLSEQKTKKILESISQIRSKDDVKRIKRMILNA